MAPDTPRSTYSTAGQSRIENAQPFFFKSPVGPIAVAHNGNLVNAEEIRTELEGQGAIFQGSSDTELLLHLIAREKGTTALERIQAALSRVRGASGRVVTSNLNRQKDQQTTAAINCEVKTTDADALLDELKKSGDMLHFQITENPDMQHATRSRRGFIIQLYAFGTVQPRETQMLQVASRDVPAGYRALLDAVNKAKGRVLNAQLNEQDKQNIFAQLDFDIRRADATAVEEVLAKLGDVYSRTATRAEDSENVLDTKLQMKVTIKNVTAVVINGDDTANTVVIDDQGNGTLMIAVDGGAATEYSNVAKLVIRTGKGDDALAR